MVVRKRILTFNLLARNVFTYTGFENRFVLSMA